MPSASFYFVEPETRKPSKVRLFLAALFLVLLVLSITFSSLYVVEKNKTTSEGGQSKQRPNGTATQSTIKSSLTPSTKTCNTLRCVVSAAGILNNLDQSTDPCEDFYQYSCGGFARKNYIPFTKLQTGSFSAPSELILQTMRDLLENKQLMSKYSAFPNSAFYKAFVYYKSCMNDSAIENAGIQPILDVIEKYGSWNITNSGWSEDSWVLEKILARVLADTGVPVFFNVRIMESVVNTSDIYVTISCGLIGHDKRLERKRWSSYNILMKQKRVEGIPTTDTKDYKELMSAIFKLLGPANSSVDNEVNRIVNLEDSFLKIREDNDTNSLKDLYKFTTIEELNKLTSLKFNWKLFLDEIFRGTDKSIAPDQKLMILIPNCVKRIANWLDDKPRSLLANEVIWKIVRTFIDNLPKAFGEKQMSYDASLGVFPTPKWKKCIALADKYFTHATNLLYVNKSVKNDDLKKAAVMFTEIKSEFIDGLEEQKWMDDASRAQARLKLEKMKTWVGYTPFVKNKTELNNYYKNFQVQESFLLENTLNAARNLFLKESQQLGKPSDESRFSTSTLEVNAKYFLLKNRVGILGGMFQTPFYGSGRPNALNYGSLGYIVGHEITHGFDNNGIYFDEYGKIREWLTKASNDNFTKLSKCFIEQYNNVTIFGYKVNGEQTLSENICDNAGLKYAYRAYQKWRETHGDEDRLPALSLDNNQLFFVSFAQTWCQKYKKRGAKYRIKHGKHSPEPVRVRVAIHNSPEFSKAFGCPLQRNTCEVW
ncbi:endothelin-converting enzyme homolog [Dendronephthya gigantea]|uniref:endothelin-converting enzyme homolog n=1 Tax=Dendronephthya gigantea TaxID=151771 RepID=UPI00106D79C7|nr:endothelin-converting enzyme homolog [Dendronephthya gigantea]